jgi:RNA polymerase sigma factor (sigma-70 family)
MSDLNNDMIFNELMRRFERMIRSEIYAYFANEMDRQDIFQEISIHILKKLRSSERLELAKWDSGGWVRIVTKNKCLDIIKKRTRELKQSKDLSDEDLFEKAANQSPYLENNDIRIDKTWKEIDVAHLLMQLAERERQIIILRYFKKMPIKDIDAIMNVSNSSVYLDRVIKKLRKINGAATFFDFFDEYRIKDQ